MSRRRHSLYAVALVALSGARKCASGSVDPDIQALNSSIGGRVHANEPFALPCFSEYEGEVVERDEALCAERQANYTSPTYRHQFPGAYMYDQSSICASDETSTDKCLLDADDPTDPAAWTGVNCRQGNLASYYVDVREANDVAQSFKYAKNSGAPISIKNSGHTYVEDSSHKGSITLWTRNLGKLSHDKQFVPENCPSDDSYDAITTGAGVSCGEAYKYADQEGVTIICGYSSTVGMSGGWVQGGGHSVLTNVYGLGVDRVLQYTVVTPDGSVRVANKCQNTDLFWALRGGGGGTFGVVLDSTHRVEPVVPLSIASISVPAANKTTYVQWMNLLVDTAVDLADDGWGGHIYGNSLVHVNPLLTTVPAASASLSKLVTFATEHGGSANITTAPAWYEFFQKFVVGSSVVVGNLNIINTRLVPTEVFRNASLVAGLKDFFADVVHAGGNPYIPVDSPYLYRVEPGAASVNPAWYSSLWELGQPSYWQWNGTLDERIAVARNMQAQTARMEAITPGGGAYKNEANPFTLDWKEAWYGENYERLLEIKNKYDPDGLLKCWGCVGWTDEDARKSCYSAFVGLKP